MKNKQVITVLRLATIFGAVSGYIGARFGAERVSAYHLAKAQNVTPFLVRVPGDTSENDQVRLEIVGEEGVIDYSRIGGKPGGREPVKVFVVEKVDGYSFSIVTTDYSSTGYSLDLGDARMRMWAGSPHRTIHGPGEILAYFGDKYDVRSDLSNETIGLRLSLIRHEPDEGESE